MNLLKGRAVLLFFVSFYSFFLLPLMPLWAQSFDLPEDIDIFAPRIRHQPLEEALQTGTPHRIEARVSDNIGVSEVILYYRKQGQEIYSSINMETIWRGEYMTQIPKEDIEAPGIEYYIQARDHAGNTSQRAFPFSPLRIEVVSLPTDQAAGSEERVVLVPVPAPAPKQERFLSDENPSKERESFAFKTKKPIEVQVMSEKKPWYKLWWVWTLVLFVISGGIAAGSGGGGGNSTGAPTTGSATISTPAP
ncbi:hypothetical protein MNBD_NITROSPIRAE01-480 [hydrothermal vent metagenome]|uniref:Uncharacterized protein n=1 Tax=hydrothermal vent metagenome TaxID=652676 RepID=A0A3B1CRC3_9ZZZZ